MTYPDTTYYDTYNQAGDENEIANYYFIDGIIVYYCS